MTSAVPGINVMSDDRKSLPEPAFGAPLYLDGALNYGMIGTSAPMRALFSALPRIAASASPLLIRGERGAGKDLVARAVHTLSGRPARPYAMVDCTAVPERSVRKALIDALQSAQGGTVVLDSVDSLSIDLQARLLRTLRSEEIDFPGVGQTQLDVRIISTTNADLELAVEQERFREALYYQLNVLSIRVPPLRERGRDVQLLADFFLDRFTTPGSRRRVIGFSAESRLAMQQWGWPGNVRELVNRIRKAIIMCERGPLYSGDLDLDGRARGRVTMTLDEARDAAELSALLTALARANGDLAIAASRLETTRVALCRLMQKHRIDVASPQLVVDADR
jgi:DNA-binding NtrC family response regulator